MIVKDLNLDDRDVLIYKFNSYQLNSPRGSIPNQINEPRMSVPTAN